MKSLAHNWLTEGLIDFEYKKYVLLAYLKNVQSEFEATRLYPYLSDLLFHYQNLLAFREGKNLLQQNFPKQITQADFEKLRLQYEVLVEDDEMMQTLEEIVEFAIPNFRNLLKEGKSLYDYVESRMEISLVGIAPLYQEEGYLMLYEEILKNIQLYEYQVSIFENLENPYRAIHLNYLETIQKSIFETFENLKLHLLRKYSKMPNPATFLIVAKVPYPLQETLLPIAKRILVRHLSQKAA
ncbi:MAG: hypothetical protein RMJ97_10865 [Raineya sp.]|nr:hypothetical protein [Raineya sp.]MDW8297369.1 hypothetical protein [Raineya sp.]